MVAEQRHCAIGTGEVDDLAAVGAAVDKVAQQHDAVILCERELREQLRELDVTTVNVADGDESPVHAAEKC